MNNAPDLLSREGYPNYGQNNKRGALPRYVFLDWSLATKATDNTQYQTWKWDLARPIEGYRYCSFQSCTFQTTTYSSQPRYLGFDIKGLNNINLDTNNTAPQIKPTFIVPNLTLTPQFYENGRDENVAIVSDTYLTYLDITFCNESLVPVPVVAVPPGPHFLYMLLKFFN